MALKVYCRSHANGCQETMSLQQIPEHLNVCPFYEVPCPLGKCKERMMRKDIPDHLSWKCKHRETSCEFCKTKMPLTDLQVGMTSPGHHYDITMTSLGHHYDITMTSLGHHYDITMTSLRHHYDITGTSLGHHYDITGTSL
ncbi:TNF receptor-associated factor 3-like [Etheostoma cragini]|uniref:TNF receptor-associated factor 3-like n=1 Tax=Etheostoma cragini TaxID=417921 RepID=UPI00155E235F|nr:TNF receptor-associated factor 3-like [Etheostoma cragini]